MKLPFLVLTAAAANAALPPPAPAPDAEIVKQGAEIYANNCAACHANPTDRIPSRAFITITKSPEFIIKALTTGAMMQQGSALSAEEKVAVATYLTGKSPGQSAGIDPMANKCQSAAPTMALTDGDWNGWSGGTPDNIRFRPNSGLTPANIGKLKLKWAFAYPGGTSGQPAVAGGRVFAPSISGVLVSLDAKTGCTYWAADLGAPLRSAVSIGQLPSGKFAAYIGDMHGDVHAIDVETGAEIWRRRIEEHRMTRLTGPMTLYNGRLYAPVSSFEESAAADPAYRCCTFRGSVVALDAAAGRILWKTYAIPRKPKPLGDGHRFGPAGAAIWSAPTIDAKRKLVYAVTGNSYTELAAPTANAVVAFDLATGAMRWSRQLEPNDNWVSGCDDKKTVNCPKGELGPDFDLAGAPLLVAGAGGKQTIVVTSKSGMVFGLDPDRRGALAWSTPGGRGGLMGGVEWGGASDGNLVYIPITDIGGRPRDASLVATPMPGLNAFDATTGKLAWRVPAPEPQCSWGQPCLTAFHAAPTAVPGMVFSGAFDGHLRAYATADGRLLWDFDTGRSFNAVNGGVATGGSIDQGGQLVVGRQLFVNSGARNGYPGNLLLAFSLED